MLAGNLQVSFGGTAYTADKDFLELKEVDIAKGKYNQGNDIIIIGLKPGMGKVNMDGVSYNENGKTNGNKTRLKINE